jgi:hypothetical protein
MTPGERHAALIASILVRHWRWESDFEAGSGLEAELELEAELGMLLSCGVTFPLDLQHDDDRTPLTTCRRTVNRWSSPTDRTILGWSLELS